jgi:hypothetical protein
MPRVITNKEINLTQLDQFLNRHGLCINDNDSLNKIIATADGSPVTQEELEIAISNHIAVFTEPTIADKLASVGLSIEELKQALGAN